MSNVGWTFFYVTIKDEQICYISFFEFISNMLNVETIFVILVCRTSHFGKYLSIWKN